MPILRTQIANGAPCIDRQIQTTAKATYSLEVNRYSECPKEVFSQLKTHPQFSLVSDSGFKLNEFEL